MKKTNAMGNKEQAVRILNLISDTLIRSGIRRFTRDDSKGIISFSIAEHYPAAIMADLQEGCLKLFCYPDRSSLPASVLTTAEILIRQNQYLILEKGGRLSHLLIPADKKDQPDGLEVIFGKLPIRRMLDRSLVQCFFELNKLLVRKNIRA